MKLGPKGICGSSAILKVFSNISRRGKKKAYVEKWLCSDQIFIAELQSPEDSSVWWTPPFIFLTVGLG